MNLDKIVTFPNPLYEGIEWQLEELPGPGVDDCEMMLWGGHCGVHTVFTPGQVEYWKREGWKVLVHPEAPLEVVQIADGSGSTAYLWNTVIDAPVGSQFAVGTEGHFVRNLKEQASLRGIEVMHLAEIDDANMASDGGCGCATMSRNDPPHLAGMLDLLRKGDAPDLNHVLAGDTVDEQTAERNRLTGEERKTLVADARSALERMIEVTEAAK
jgi:quinolinate synthase